MWAVAPAAWTAAAGRRGPACPGSGGTPKANAVYEIRETFGFSMVGHSPRRPLWS